MLVVDSEQIIHITRGDVGVIEVSANDEPETLHKFQPGDIVRLRVFVRKQPSNVVLIKDARVAAETEFVDINLESADTKLGEIINKPVDYWYEIELNPETTPQTIVGYDADGPKIFRLYPEGGDIAV